MFTSLNWTWQSSNFFRIHIILLANVIPFKSAWLTYVPRMMMVGSVKPQRYQLTCNSEQCTIEKVWKKAITKSKWLILGPFTPHCGVLISRAFTAYNSISEWVRSFCEAFTTDNLNPWDVKAKNNAQTTIGFNERADVCLFISVVFSLVAATICVNSVLCTYLHEDTNHTHKLHWTAWYFVTLVLQGHLVCT